MFNSSYKNETTNEEFHATVHCLNCYFEAETTLHFELSIASYSLKGVSTYVEGDLAYNIHLRGEAQYTLTVIRLVLQCASSKKICLVPFFCTRVRDRKISLESFRVCSMT